MVGPICQSVKEGLGEKHMVYEGFKWREFDEIEVGSRSREFIRDGEIPKGCQ